MTDPRERVETEHVKCSFSVAGTWLIESDREDIYPCAPWPEIVAFAQKILAANEAWLDANTPTLDELLARYPDWRATCVFVRTGWRIWAERLRAPGHPTGQDNFPSEGAALRWLAAKLEELTDGK